MYYDELLETVDDLSITKKMKSTEMEKNADKNYDKFTIPFNNTWRDGKFYKKVTIEIYGSGQQGSKIRNAVTGERYSYLVGSAAEDLFFKVVDSTARNGRKEPFMLYYDTPEQYENNHFTTVETDVKERWYEKWLYAIKRMTKV
jgi:hypothetical protein